MARHGVCVGVDLGGSKIHVGAVDHEGRIHASRRAPTGAERGVAAVVETIGTLAEQCADEAGAPALAVGVGVAGQIDTRAGGSGTGRRTLTGSIGAAAREVRCRRRPGSSSARPDSTSASR